MLLAPAAHADCSAPALQAALALGSATFSRDQLDTADWSNECQAEAVRFSAANAAALYDLHNLNGDPRQHATFASRNSGRYQLDSGTRLDGWQVGSDLYFGRSKGDVRGVALIWQPSNDRQVALSGSGIKVTRRLR